MNIHTKIIHAGRDFQKKYPRVVQWLWFIGLWFGGLFTVTVLTYPIKLIIKNM